MCSSGLEAQTFDLPLHPLLPHTRCYHQCFLVFRGLSVYMLLRFSLSFVVRWGIFKNFFCFCVGFASSLTKLWLVRLWQCACKWCGHHFISFLLFSSFDFINSSFSLPYFVSYQSLVWSSSLSMVGFRCFISSSLVHK